MTIEEQLREAILSQYKSVRQFSIQIGIPQSTIATILTHGIVNSSVSTIITVFHALDLDMESIPSGELKKTPRKGQEDLKGEPVSRDQIERVLLSLRVIEPWEDVTDEDFRFLSVWLDGLNSWFEKKRQDGED